MRFHLAVFYCRTFAFISAGVEMRLLLIFQTFSIFYPLFSETLYHLAYEASQQKHTYTTAFLCYFFFFLKNLFVIFNFFFSN